MTRSMVIYHSCSVVCDTAPVLGCPLNLAPPPCPSYLLHPPCDAACWHHFPCLPWMDGPPTASSSTGASPTSSGWRLAPLHHPPVIGTHLLALTSLLCQAPTSSGGVPSLVQYPPLAILVIEVPLELILMRSVMLSMVLPFPLNSIVMTLFLLILTSYAIGLFLLPISVNSSLSSHLAQSRNFCALLHMTSDCLVSCASCPMTVIRITHSSKCKCERKYHCHQQPQANNKGST